ncbi:hypothetical protein N6H14_03245 [Paenibacillus sp. CC-CFT747]|nr:hypothetical protein N6H14_03245 [Paenibacillus sp. CC-CFT747]
MDKNLDKIKGYMEKLKASASNLVTERQGQEERDEEDTSVILDRRVYTMLRQRAEHRHTTVEALVERAVQQYIAAQAAEKTLQVSVERKENNPLLYLDGLTKNLD